MDYKFDILMLNTFGTEMTVPAGSSDFWGGNMYFFLITNNNKEIIQYLLPMAEGSYVKHSSTSF